MGTYVTPQGLQIPSVDDILGELSEEQRSTIDPLLNTDPDSPVGQMNGIFAAHLRRGYEVLLIAWGGNDPNSSEGSLLENVSAITGTRRAPATPSKFTGTRRLRVTLNAAITVLSGTGFHVLGDPNTSFHTIENVTSVLAGDYLVSAESDATGPIVCNATTLTVISTPVGGLTAVINDSDAELGTNLDDDPELRIRREQELRATGSGTVDSLRADLLAVKLGDGSKPILECVVLENRTLVTDANGLPGKSLECLIYDGVALDCPDTVVAQTIWDSKPGGIELYGSSTALAVDTQGNNRTIAFSRATLREVITLATLILTNGNQVPAQYLSAVQAAIIAKFGDLKMGGVIRATHLIAAIVAIPGIEDVSIQIGFLSVGLQGPDVNLALGVREMCFIQTTGITVA